MRGHADIVHSMLQHGASASAQNENGDTPIHLAVFHGHERCVWVLLNVGAPDLDIENNEGQCVPCAPLLAARTPAARSADRTTARVLPSRGRTPLVKGYTMLWQRPPEPMLRAVSTLAQWAGVERIKRARDVVDEQIRKKLKQRRALVDHAADGNVDEMLVELQHYADPDSKDKDGLSALEAAVTAGYRDAVELLLDFKASLTTISGHSPVVQRALDVKDYSMAAALIAAGAPFDDLKAPADADGTHDAPMNPRSGA